MDFITKGATRLLMDEDIVEERCVYIAECPRHQAGRLPRLDHRPQSRRNEQAFFGLAHDATVFEIFRTAFDQREPRCA